MGLKCAPEIGPNVRIRAMRAAPVAIEFASRAIATFPAASRSPMMPEPTMAASNRAVPTASLVARRASEKVIESVCTAVWTAAGGWLRFASSNERAGEASLDVGCYMFNVESAFGEECARVFKPIHTPRLDIDVIESRCTQLR